jgi:bacterioferritin
MPTQEHSKLIEALNRMLAQEHACAIRYATHAAVISGPYSEAISARLKEIASDEIEHAQKLRGRITALGGIPTMSVQVEDFKPASKLKEILEVNISEERGAIASYGKIVESIPRANVILFETLEDILKDEQEHLEELENLRLSE